MNLDRSSGRARASRLLALAVACLAAAPAGAQVAGEIPDALQEVGIRQNLDAQVPLELAFTDENGQPITLQRYFQGDRPVVLALVYYRCPMLCDLVLNGLVVALRELDWMPGREFDVVAVSFDPKDTTAKARRKKQSYLASYGREQSAAGWHFLTGEVESIRALTSAVGFGYRYLPDQDEFSHPAAVMLLTPDGRVSRYLLGIDHQPQTVRLALAEASQGRIGSVVDKFLLYCYRYDAEKGRYAPVAVKIMRLGGGAAVLALGGLLFVLWRREARIKRQRQATC